MKIEIEVNDDLMQEAVLSQVAKNLKASTTLTDAIKAAMHKNIDLVLDSDELKARVEKVIDQRVEVETQIALDLYCTKKIEGWVKHHVHECMKYARMRVFRSDQNK